MMNTLPSAETPDVAELRILAENATPGPWDYYRPHPNYRTYEVSQVMPAGYLGEAVAATEDVYAEKNAAFIAAANPVVMLGLLDRLAHITSARDAARAEVARLTALLAETEEPHPDSNWLHQPLVALDTERYRARRAGE